MQSNKERKKVVAIIGGHKKTHFDMNCNNFEFIFDDGRNQGKDFSNIVRNCDCVVVILEFISHPSMKKVRAAAEALNVPILWKKKFGATGTIRQLNTIFNAVA